MNYFERIMKGRLFSRSEKLPEKVIRFTFMDRMYLLEDFSINFHQEMDTRGRLELPAGGMIHLTMAETPDYYINEWIHHENLLRDGEIRFLSGDIKVTSGADLIISFWDAYCIEYKKHIHTLKGGLFTSLTISPRTLKIGNEEFSNKWKQEEDLPYYIRSGREKKE
ncbi:MAG: hypothetical protein LBL07_04815 [Tannerella sp.]|jgi:hypothetical protein|nr:hypothetical protein [Tannerella sp.]